MAGLPKYISDIHEFNEYRKRVRALRTQLEGVVEAGQSAVEGAKGTYSQAQIELANLQKVVAEAAVALKALPTYEAELARHQKLLEDPKAGTQAQLNRNAELEKNLSGSIESTNVLAQQLNAAIGRAEELNRDAQEILKHVTAGSLADAFGKRAAAIDRSKFIWQIIIGAGVSLLLIVLAVVYWQFMNEIDAAKAAHKTAELNTALTIMRIGFFTPLIFVVYFAARQYTKERDLQESYEYKSSVAATLPAFTKLLKDEFVTSPNDPVYTQVAQQAILDKTLAWIDIVYADTKDIENHSSLAVRVKNSLFGAEIEQTTRDKHKHDSAASAPAVQVAEVITKK